MYCKIAFLRHAETSCDLIHNLHVLYIWISRLYIFKKEKLYPRALTEFCFFFVNTFVVSSNVKKDDLFLFSEHFVSLLLYTSWLLMIKMSLTHD